MLFFVIFIIKYSEIYFLFYHIYIYVYMYVYILKWIGLGKDLFFKIIYFTPTRVSSVLSLSSGRVSPLNYIVATALIRLLFSDRFPFLHVLILSFSFSSFSFYKSVCFCLCVGVLLFPLIYNIKKIKFISHFFWVIVCVCVCWEVICDGWCALCVCVRAYLCMFLSFSVRV